MIKNPKRFFDSYKARNISPILCLLAPLFHLTCFPPSELSSILNLHTLGLYFFASIAALSNYSAGLILVAEVSSSAFVSGI